MSRRRRAAALLGLALLLGVLAASDIAGRESALREQLGSPVRVVVAREQLATGERITSAALAVREVPSLYAPKGALRDPLAAVGRRAAVPVAAGAYVDPAILAVPGAQTQPDPPPARRGDQRAFDLVAIGAPDAIVAGARVDVVVTDDAHNGGAGATYLALGGARVLASRAAPADDAQAGLPRVLATLRVSMRQALALAAAVSRAREVRLLPRPER
jgi:pilus assembly protein CpaB